MRPTAARRTAMSVSEAATSASSFWNCPASASGMSRTARRRAPGSGSSNLTRLLKSFESTYSVECVPSQSGFFAECLQPQKYNVRSLFASNGIGTNSDPLCEPSQNGWLLLLPHAHHQYLVPVLTSTAYGDLGALWGLVISRTPLPARSARLIGTNCYSNCLGSHHGKNSGMSFETFPGNFAARFSRNDSTPSRASGDRPVQHNTRESRFGPPLRR